MNLRKFVCGFFAATIITGPVFATQYIQSTIYIDAFDTPNSSTWNKVNFSSTLPVENLINSDSNVTQVDVDIVKRLWGGNSTSTSSPIGDAAEFQPAGNSQSFGCYSNFTGTATHYTQGIANITGLLPGTNYNFTFYASRISVSDNRQTLYSLTGANSGSATLNVHNNTSEVAEVNGIVADSNGEIELRVSMGPNNNNSEGFFYLLAMKIEGVVEQILVPQPEFPVYLNFSTTIASPNATGIGNAAGAQYNFLVDSNNVHSALSLEVKHGMSGPRTVDSNYYSSFTGDALEFGLGCRTGIYGSSSNPYGEYEITGADPNYRYTFTFFGCREGATDVREAMFIVDGAASSTNYLNASSNYSEVAVIDSVKCDSNGVITITVEKGPNNTNSSYWAYLNAMKIEAVEMLPAGTIILLQ